MSDRPNITAEASSELYETLATIYNALPLKAKAMPDGRWIEAVLARARGDTIIEESERLDGTIMQTVRLADGKEVVRPAFSPA